VLTRDKNVLKGDRLTYNLATGKSAISGGGAAAKSGGKDRVRALFVPDGAKDKP
jgi:lipopolysaccharide export system protein LptA